MNWVDVVIGCVMIFTVVGSLIRGLVREITEVFGLIIAIFLAYKYYQDGGAYLIMAAGFPPALANGIAFVLIALGVALVAGIAGRLLSRIVHFTPIAIVDRLGGLVFGLAKGFLFTCIFVVALEIIPTEFTYVALEESYVAQRVLKVVPQVYPELEALFPEEFPRWQRPSKNHREGSYQGSFEPL